MASRVARRAAGVVAAGGGLPTSGAAACGAGVGRARRRVVAADRRIERPHRAVATGQRQRRARGDEEDATAGRPGVPPPVTDRAAAGGGLDVAVGELGHHHGEHRRGQERTHLAVGRADEHEDRPVPQVQAVAATARRRRAGPQPSAGRTIRDDGCTATRTTTSASTDTSGEQPLVHVGGRQRRRGGRAGQRGQRHPARGVQHPARVAARAARLAARAPHEGRRRAEQQPARSGDRRQVQEVRAVDATEQRQRARPTELDHERDGHRDERRSIASSRATATGRSRVAVTATNTSGHTR